MDKEIFICALAYADNHFIEWPITLACGQSACYGCIETFQKTTALTHVKCQSCNKLSSLNAEHSESFLAQKFREMLIDFLKVEFENEMENYKSKFKETLVKINLFKDAIFEFR